ncbi:Pex14-N domain-containing protein [Mycena kentingensis (nom. inval.)]|nr:Pex14-N domain-containing protein [Mycena kentingensis (nom. inval.)]
MLDGRQERGQLWWSDERKRGGEGKEFYLLETELANLVANMKTASHVSVTHPLQLMSARDDLIQNAVAFLNDPNTQASPFAQRIQFLEAKGLTPPEIDLAVRQAAQQYPPYSLPPPSYKWDWRDYFITAVVSGTITYGAVALFKVAECSNVHNLTSLQKYLLPHLQPPTSTAYEADRDALTAQFDAAEAILKEIQAESSAVRVAVEAQKERIDETTKNVDAMVQELRDGETKTRDEMREVREEINSIREMPAQDD